MATHNCIGKKKSRRLNGRGMWHAWERRENAWISLESKILVGRCRCQLDDNIKMYVREIGNKSVDWIDLVLDVVGWRAFTEAVIRGLEL